MCFVDASFAPDGNRSHTGWLIQLGGNTIAWRSSRQSCITLSTAESELEAATEGLVALQGLQAILADIGAGLFPMYLQSDSTSALAIAHGSCSWAHKTLEAEKCVDRRIDSAWWCCVHPLQRRCAASRYADEAVVIGAYPFVEFANWSG